MKQKLSKSKRIVTLDLIRGYFLLVILINHLNRFPGFYDIFTGRGQLWTSAAEGFFLISGVLVGIVRGAEVKSGHFWEASRKMVTRGFYLYLWTVVLTVVFTLLGMHYLKSPGLTPGIIPIHRAKLASAIGNILSLRYVYGWANFLQYYAPYMLLSPIFLGMLYRRLLIPALLIVAIAFSLRSHSSYLVWQIYFFGGAAIGYYWQDIEGFFKDLKARDRAIARVSLYGLALAVLAADIIGVFGYRLLERHDLIGAGLASSMLTNLHNLSHSWFNRYDPLRSYGYGRVFVSLVWFSALFVFVRRHEEFFKKYLGRLLLPVGCNPLLVYGFDSFLIFAADLIWRHDLSFVANVAINTLAILLSLGVASFQIRRRRSQNLLAV